MGIDLQRDNFNHKLDSENFKKLHTDDMAEKENSDDAKIAEIENVRKPLTSINANRAMNTLKKMIQNHQRKIFLLSNPIKVCVEKTIFIIKKKSKN